MTRKTGQILALLGIIVLVVVSLWYQMSMETSLKGSVLDQAGLYGYDKYDLTENPPDKRTVVAGVLHLHYRVPFGDLVIMDALQVPQSVPSVDIPVLWEPDFTNTVEVQVEDETAPRTAFIAPREATTIGFMLKLTRRGESGRSVARYVFEVVDPAVLRADVNNDGRFTFEDLLNFLQTFDPNDPNYTRVLSVILSEYEEEEE